MTKPEPVMSHAAKAAPFYQVLSLSLSSFSLEVSSPAAPRAFAAASHGGIALCCVASSARAFQIHKFTNSPIRFGAGIRDHSWFRLRLASTLS